MATKKQILESDELLQQKRSKEILFQGILLCRGKGAG